MVHKYYQKHKEKVRKEACEKYQNLFEDEKEKNEKWPREDIKIFMQKKEKEKKRQYYHERNKNLSDKEKEKKAEHMRNYYLAHKKQLLSYCFRVL